MVDMSRVSVIGYGVEGREAVRYWLGLGDEVAVHDRRSDIELPPGVEARLGAGYLDGLEAADLVVRTAGLRPDALAGARRVTSVTAEFLERCPVPVIGVTGTKGKGTTASAAAAILRAAGRRVFLGGNIGTPPLAFLADLRAGDLVVLELSSFQLMDLDRSPQVAVVLSITPDHLDWHRSLEEYVAAKGRIVAAQTPGDLVVYDASSPPAAAIAARSRASRVPVGAPEGVEVREGGVWIAGRRLLDAADVPLIGAHNLVNVAAATAATYDLVGGDAAHIRAGVRSLEPLPHRLQIVAADGVTWVDDSISTTPETAAAALASFDAPKLLILGGSGKGVSFAPLAAASARSRLRRILLVGAEAGRIAAALDEAGVRDYEHAPGGMAEVVARAAALARPGDVVLLSPACASFDGFRDYADRGEQFAEAVRRLPRRG